MRKYLLTWHNLLKYIITCVTRRKREKKPKKRSKDTHMHTHTQQLPSVLSVRYTVYGMLPQTKTEYNYKGYMKVIENVKRLYR